MLENLFQLKNKHKQVLKLTYQSKLKLISLISVAGAVVFLVVVFYILYKTFLITFFETKKTIATTGSQIKEKKLQKAIELIKEWQSSQVVLNHQSKSPELTPFPTLNRAQVRLSLQNGTTIDGLASEIAEKLKALGYLQIQSSNAENKDYPKTIIRIKKEYLGYSEDLLRVLALPPEAVLIEDLQEEINFDIVIIIGGEGR